MIKESGIDFATLEDDAFDMPFGISSGSGVIFGATGGVAEAVARCCNPDKSKNAALAIEYSGLRGMEGVRVATMLLGNRTIRLAVCNGLSNAQKLIDEIETGREYFDLIEVMTCRTGCVGGAASPTACRRTRSSGPPACTTPTGPPSSSAASRTRPSPRRSGAPWPAGSTSCSTSTTNRIPCNLPLHAQPPGAVLPTAPGFSRRRRPCFRLFPPAGGRRRGPSAFSRVNLCRGGRGRNPGSG